MVLLVTMMLTGAAVDNGDKRCDMMIDGDMMLRMVLTTTMMMR